MTKDECNIVDSTIQNAICETYNLYDWEYEQIEKGKDVKLNEEDLADVRLVQKAIKTLKERAKQNG